MCRRDQEEGRNHLSRQLLHFTTVFNVRPTQGAEVREQKVKRKKETNENPTTPTTETADKPRKQQHVQGLLAPQLKGLFSYSSCVPDSCRL